MESSSFFSEKKELKFALFGNSHQPKKSAHVGHLFQALQAYPVEVLIDDAFYRSLPEELRRAYPSYRPFQGDDFEADMILSIGGDGTFLKSASRVKDRNIPILGINTGRLGFLADISPEEIEVTLQEMVQGQFHVEERSVLQLSCEGGSPLEGYPFALNEIAVLKHDSSSMISIHTSINGRPLTTFQADGLIIATPTGSTAYSLSVGGPIMVPHAETIALTPVAPHSLNMRPIVLRDDWKISLEVESRSHNFLVAVDGRSESCKEGTLLTIQKADYSIKVAKRFDHVFFHTLREKMMWGADNR